MENTILNEYDNNLSKYNIIEQEFEKKLKEILKSLKTHKIYWRVKDRESLEKKIISKWYTSIKYITDIIWLRVITFFPEEIDLVHKKIAENFEISFYDSIDKRNWNPREFWYKSLHLIINYEWVSIEIQIRTILQHAWAEIEHWIWYKSHFWIPNKIRRSFSRISWMLEMCDMEFSYINKEKNSFSIDIDAEKELYKDGDIKIDTFKKYIDDSKIIQFIDQEIADYYWISKLWWYVTLDKEVHRLIFFWIKKYWDLNTLLIENKNEIIRFSSTLINIPKWDTPHWISIFYLCYKLISDKSLEEIKEYLSLHTEIKNKDEVANKIYELKK